MKTTVKTAVSLFEQGYRVRACAQENTLVVKNPAGVRYTVNPVTGSCSCKWGEHRASIMGGDRLHTCKHIREIKALVLAEWSADLPASTHADHARYNRHDAQMYALICRLDAIERAQRAAEFAAPVAAPVSLVEAAVGADGWAKLSSLRVQEDDEEDLEYDDLDCAA